MPRVPGMNLRRSGPAAGQACAEHRLAPPLTPAPAGEAVSTMRAGLLEALELLAGLSRRVRALERGFLALAAERRRPCRCIHNAPRPGGRMRGRGRRGESNVKGG